MMMREPKYYLERGIQWFRDLMMSLGVSVGSQTNVPGKRCRITKSSQYPGKEAHKSRGKKTNTKGRRRR